ncbi:MAG: hypothetical protein KGK07_13430 [Chloroflexota bacterium]|nr:hypothetical protein [Chloroflexota bacterium]
MIIDVAWSATAVVALVVLGGLVANWRDWRHEHEHEWSYRVVAPGTYLRRCRCGAVEECTVRRYP